MGEKRLQSMFCEICKETIVNLEGRKISNHSGRKTGTQPLCEDGFDETKVREFSGHTSRNGLQPYFKVSDNMKIVTASHLVPFRPEECNNDNVNDNLNLLPNESEIV